MSHCSTRGGVPRPILPVAVQGDHLDLQRERYGGAPSSHHRPCNIQAAGGELRHPRAYGGGGEEGEREATMDEIAVDGIGRLDRCERRLAAQKCAQGIHWRRLAEIRLHYAHQTGPRV